MEDKSLKYVVVVVIAFIVLGVISGSLGGAILLWFFLFVAFFVLGLILLYYHKKKTAKKSEKEKEFLKQLEKQYPYSFESNSLSDNKRINRLKPYHLIKSELGIIEAKGIGANCSELDYCSPYSFRVYMGNNDKGKYKDIFNTLFSKYTIAVDYFIRNEYLNNKYLNYIEKRTLHVKSYLSDDEIITYNTISDSYKGNLDSLSFEQKMFLATHVSIITKLYTKYVQLAQNRKTVDALYHQCPRAFDYYCKKLIQKTTTNRYGYKVIKSLVFLSTDEISLLASKKEECEKLEQDWDCIDYDKAMSRTTDANALQSIGKQLENELEKERIRKKIESSKSDETPNYSSFSLSEALSEATKLIKEKESEKKEQPQEGLVHALRNFRQKSQQEPNHEKKEKEKQEPQQQMQQEVKENPVENNPKRKLSRPLNPNTKRMALLVAKQLEVTERWIRYNGHLSIYDATEVYLQLTELGVLSRLRHSGKRVFKKVICHDIDVINRIIDENSN